MLRFYSLFTRRKTTVMQSPKTHVSPLKIVPLIEAQRADVFRWLNEPAIYQALEIVAPVTAVAFTKDELCFRDSPQAQRVKFYTVFDRQLVLIGFAFSMGWDGPDDQAIRELDLALPNLTNASPMLGFEAVVRLAHACFFYENVRELRAHVRALPKSGWEHIFAAIGAQEIKRTFSPGSSQKKGLMRVRYGLTREAFSKSRGAKKFACVL